MAKLTFKEDLCKGCGLCVKFCPKGVLALARRSRKEKEHPEMFRMPKQKVNSFCSRQLFPQA